jgi:acyl-CoA thioester hydrolase
VKPNPRRLDLGIYPHQLEIAARFSDIDVQRHLNNVRLMEFYQEARVSFQHALRDEFGLVRTRGSRTLAAHQSVDFLGEVAYPGRVTLGTGVLQVGNSSFALGTAMFQNERCVGLSRTVLVHADQNGPAPLPTSLREALQNKLLPEDARTD